MSTCYDKITRFHLRALELFVVPVKRFELFLPEAVNADVCLVLFYYFFFVRMHSCSYLESRLQIKINTFDSDKVSMSPVSLINLTQNNV